MTSRRHAIGLFAVALIIATGGSVLAAGQYPGGFDWQYTVISALASRKYNPEGSRWLAGALALSMALLFPAVQFLRRGQAPKGVGWRAVTVLQCGLAAALLLGLERLLIFHLSDVIGSAHEALAVLAFLCVYAGLVTLYVVHMRRGDASKWSIVAILAPLAAAAAGQLVLYLAQRDIGWVGVRWREIGIPVWLSLAFWQWLAVVTLWLALGHLIVAQDGARSAASETPNGS